MELSKKTSENRASDSFFRSLMLKECFSNDETHSKVKISSIFFIIVVFLSQFQ